MVTGDNTPLTGPTLSLQRAPMWMVGATADSGCATLPSLSTLAATLTTTPGRLADSAHTQQVTRASLFTHSAGFNTSHRKKLLQLCHCLNTFLFSFFFLFTIFLLWFTPVILATQEAKIRRSQFEASPGQIFGRPCLKKNLHKKGVPQAVRALA
jgi:hypothetical protein